MDPFLVRLLIAALVWFLLDLVFNEIVKDPKTNKTLHVILLIGIVCYVVLGRFLPF